MMTEIQTPLSNISFAVGDGLREIVKAAFSEAVTAVLSRGTLVDVNISERSNNVVGDYQVASRLRHNILIALEHFSPCSVTALCRYLLN